MKRSALMKMANERTCVRRYACFIVILAMFGGLALSTAATNAHNGSVKSLNTNATSQLLLSISEKFRFAVTRNVNGDVVSIGLPSMYGDDQSMALVGTLSNVSQIDIFQGGWTNIPILTEHGINCLVGLPKLTDLKLLCLNKFSSNVLRGVAGLTQVRELTIYNVPFPSEEYRWLKSMTNLAKLDVESCSNFRDQEVFMLTNLPNLREVRLWGTGVSLQGANVFKSIPLLTNVVFRFRERAAKNVDPVQGLGPRR